MPGLIQDYQQAREEGRTPEELLRLMHERGLTITEAIKAFMKVYQVPLGEAKETVCASPFWRAIVEASQPLHDQLAETLRQDAKN